MKKIKLLLLSDANSVHTIKWVNVLAKSKLFDIYIFSLNSVKEGIYANLDVQITTIFDSYELKKNQSKVDKLKYLIALPKLLKVIKEFKPDIVHAHYASSYGLLGRLTRFHPFIISVWGSDVYTFPNLSIIHKFILKSNLKSADRVLATGKMLSLETQKYTNKEILITPFGVDIELFKEKPVEKPIFSDEDFVIGTIKSLEPVYGIDLLIKAFAIIKNKYADKPIKLLIVGEGSEKQKLIDLTKELNIEKNVNFLGFIEQKQLPIYYNMIDVFVALSLSESFGVAIVEASSCSRAVVVSNVGGLPEVVDHNHTGYVVAERDENAAAAAIETLMNDATLRQTMGKNGRLKVEKLYDWEKNASSMIALYQEIVQNQSVSS